MPPAFPDIPEPASATTPPLEAMAACNERLLRHGAALRRLGLYVGECGFDAEARAATARLLHFFDRVLPLHHAVQEADLYPALLDAMAGSDAVCLQDLTTAAAQQHRDLWRLWLRLRPALLDLSSGRATALPVHEIEAFLAQCQAGVAREDGELLPMAARLLSDAQRDALGAAMRQRRPPLP